MPSRMSCSLATTDGIPARSMITRSIRAPAPITSARPGCITGRSPAAAPGSRRAGPRSPRPRRRTGPGRGGCARVVLRQARGERGHRGDRAGEPDQGGRLAARHGRAAPGRPPPRCRPRAAAISAGVGGSPCRCRSVIRTQPMSTEIAALDPGRPVADRRTRSSRRRCRRPGTARSASAGSPRTAPVKESRASSSPVTTSGSTPRVAQTIAGKSARVRGVPGRRGGAHPHPLARPAPRSRRRSRPARPGSARSPPARAGRCGRRPRPAGRSPSAGSGRSAAPPARRGVGQVGDQQSDRVGPAVDGRHTRRHGSNPTAAPGGARRAGRAGGSRPGRAGRPTSPMTTRHRDDSGHHAQQDRPAPNSSAPSGSGDVGRPRRPARW